jgi:hypothetical protein
MDIQHKVGAISARFLVTLSAHDVDADLSNKPTDRDIPNRRMNLYTSSVIVSSSLEPSPCFRIFRRWALQLTQAIQAHTVENSVPFRTRYLCFPVEAEI